MRVAKTVNGRHDSGAWDGNLIADASCRSGSGVSFRQISVLAETLRELRYVIKTIDVPRDQNVVIRTFANRPGGGGNSLLGM